LLAAGIVTGVISLSPGQQVRALPAGKALDFDGTNDYVTFGTASGLGVTTFTIEAWITQDGAGATTTTSSAGGGGFTSTNPAVPILTKGRGEGDNSNVDMNWFLGLQANKIAVDYEEGAGQVQPGQNHAYTGTTTIVNGRWYHAAATFDGTTLRLYLNGVEEGTGLNVGAGSRLPRSDSIQHAGLATAMTSTGLAQGFFNGVIDEARVWNVARSGSAILTGL